jgi:hypothetical protein
MYKIKTTKQAFDLINEQGVFDEPFIIHEAHAYDQSFNVGGLIDLVKPDTADALLKGKADQIDYTQLAKTVVDSDLYEKYKSLDLREKDVVKSGVIEKGEFDPDKYEDFARRRDIVNQQVVIDSTSDMQTLVDSGILTQTEIDGEWRYLAMPGLIKDVDFNQIIEPGSNSKAEFYVDYATLINCKASKDVQIAWSHIVSCELGEDSVLSQNHLSAMRDDKPTIIGDNAQVLNCSADGATIGANSLVFSMQRCPVVNSNIGDNCHLIGGLYVTNKYGSNVHVDVPSSEVIKDALSGEHLSKRRNARAYWKSSPITSEADLAGSTTVIFPKELNNIDNMIQFTDSANKVVKRGIIGGSVSVGIEGATPAPFHGAGPEIRAEFRKQHLAAQDANLSNLLNQNKEELAAHVRTMFKSYFGLESKVDMFDNTGGDPVYKNQDLIENVVDRISDGFKDTLLNSRSHKDLSNDHKFATDVVNMVKQEVASSYKLSADDLTARGHKFKFNMEKSKRLLREIVTVIPALNDFNIIKSEQAKELSTLSDDCMDDVGQELSYEEIQNELSGDIYDSDGVRIVDDCEIMQIETANGQSNQMDMFAPVPEHKEDAEIDFYDEHVDYGVEPQPELKP